VERGTGAEQAGQAARVGVGVVHAVEEQVLDEDPPAGALAVAAARLQDAGDREAARDRHELFAQLVGGGVEGERQAHGQRLVGQPLDPGHPAGCRDRNVTCAEVEALRVVHGVTRRQHLVVVQERLAHAHHDDVPDGRPAVAQDAGQRQELLDDLARPQAAPEAHLAGRAERAGERAARLGREAGRAPAAMAHRHRLDRKPVPGREPQLHRAVG
jgi:hypothetical protein